MFWLQRYRHRQHINISQKTKEQMTYRGVGFVRKTPVRGSQEPGLRVTNTHHGPSGKPRVRCRYINSKNSWKFIFSLCCYSTPREEYRGMFKPFSSLRRRRNQKLSPDYVMLRSLRSIWNCRQCVYIILYSDNHRPRQTAGMKSNKYLNSTPP